MSGTIIIFILLSLIEFMFQIQCVYKSIIASVFCVFFYFFAFNASAVPRVATSSSSEYMV